MAETVRVIISGRVQGVGYRAWTVVTATEFRLKGWVRNRNDGSVEAVFHGTREQIDDMFEACKKGPASARVDKIEAFSWSEELNAQHFESKPTV